MSRRFIIAGNWKMNTTRTEARTLAQAMVEPLGNQTQVDVVLCPPFTALGVVAETLKGRRIFLGAQDLHWESQGAFTGEVSGPMLKDAGCRYTIIGHSERRHGLGETDAVVHQKLLAALGSGLCAILCVGETLQERQAGQTGKVVEKQLTAALEAVESSRIAREVVVAYEPVWAIGTGKNATPAQAQEVHGDLRDWLTARIGKELASATRIQYGGSVKPDNAGELLNQPDVDGALVGGASLDPKSFISIVEAALHAKGDRCSTPSS